MTFTHTTFRRRGTIAGVATACLLATVIADAGRAPVRGQAGQSPQAASLKIVVIAGEDAVNVIQQKTAVNPVVEVRDRNDLPVAGVPVTFSIGGSNAAFGGGLQTLTVTTNAAGRAAVTSLNPVGSGAVQINVTATYQGQTATATITQTNFATAAAAASAGAAAGGGGGGLSGLAIAAIAGGVGAGALVAAKAASGGGGGGGGGGSGGGGGGGGGTGGGGPTTPCTFNIGDRTSIMVPSFSTTLGVVVNAEPSNCEPRTWTATSNASFITVTSDATRALLNIETNPNGSPPRTGTVTVAGQTVTIIQNASCTLAVSPLLATFPAAGGTVVITVTLSPPGCDRAEWTAAAPALVAVNPTAGTGSGTVTLTLQPNPTAFSRGATLFVTAYSGTQLVVINQSATGACLSPIFHGGDIAQTNTIQLGRSAGRFTFSYDTGVNNPDRMVVTYEGRTLFDTGCVATAVTRVQPLTFSGNTTTATVQVIPNCAGGTGSTWSFVVSCQP